MNPVSYVPLSQGDAIEGREQGGSGAVQPLTVAFGIDNTFAVPLAATLHSLLRGLPGEVQPHLYIVSRDITPANKARLQRVVAGRAVLYWPTVTNLPIDPGLLATKIHYLSLAAYYRVLLPALLPPDCSRVIYLDADVIVQGDLRKLWETDMDGHLLMAVRDASVFEAGAPNGIRKYRELGIPPHAPYFNSGVLLIDVDGWRAQGITRQFFQYSETYGTYARFADQDGLNAVLHQRWAPLNERWNLQTFVVDDRHRERKASGPRRAYLTSLRERRHLLTEDAFIIHFTEPRKPWHPGCTHPYRSLFYDHLRTSGCFRSVLGYGAWRLYRHLVWYYKRLTTPDKWKTIWEKNVSRIRRRKTSA